MLFPPYEDVSPNVVLRLQKQIGLIVAVASAVLAPLSLLYSVFVYQRTVAEAAADPSFWATGIWVPIGLLTAFRQTHAGRVMQAAIAYVAALLSALTIRFGDLTSLLFLGLSIALTHWYRLAPRRGRVIYPVGIALFAAAVTAGMTQATTSPAVAIPHWSIGAIAVLLIIVSLLRASQSSHAAHREMLENKVTERTHQIREALKESEALRERNLVLLQEVHHRTKNSLQLISSLLSLEESDPALASRSAKQVLETNRRRVQSMATAYELLHDSEKSSVVDLRQFIESLTHDFVDNSTDITLEVSLEEDVPMMMESAVPLGLAINELVMSSTEYPSTEHPSTDTFATTVHIALTQKDRELELTIEDRSTSGSERLPIDNPDSTEMQIVMGLVSQIDGEIELERRPHRTWSLRARLPQLAS